MLLILGCHQHIKFVMFLYALYDIHTRAKYCTNILTMDVIADLNINMCCFPFVRASLIFTEAMPIVNLIALAL